MPEQLFLFEDSEDKKEKQPLETTGNMTDFNLDEEADHNMQPAAIAKQEIQIEQEMEAGTNPFAEVERKRQDEIDNLLLMPKNKRGRKSFKAMDEEAILPEVPNDDVLFQKQYYTTRIVADWFGITQSQLRQWETEFDVLQPKKNSKGDRYFRPEDVKNLKIIYHLLRRRKFTVQGAKQYMDENKKKLQNTMQLTESLNKFRQFLLELKAIST